MALILLVFYMTGLSAGVLFAATDPITVPPNTPVETSSPYELTLPDTALRVTGCASPNAFVTFFRDNVPVGTVVADSTGRYSKTIVADGPGLMNVKAYFDDVNGRTSSTISENISLAAHVTTTTSILLPTTIEHEPEPLVVGEYLIFRGTTCPKALVNVVLDNNFTLAARADERGNWYVIADSSDFFVGQHTYQAISSLSSQISNKTEKYQLNAIHSDGSGGSDSQDSLLIAPQILDPPDGFLTSTSDVLISGIGPTNTQLEIIIDGKVVGSVFTNHIGEWSFKMFMNADQHVVQARACRDNSCSELSNTVRIYYSGDLGLCSITFELSKYRFWGLREEDSIDLDLVFASGTPEYDVLIDWGDAVVEHITLYRNDPIKLHHIYDRIGQYNGIITIKDSKNCVHTQYFSVNVGDGSQLAIYWLLTLPTLLLLFLALYYAMGRRERRRRAKQRLAKKPSQSLPPIRHFPN